MQPEDRSEGLELEPANEQLAIGRVIRIAVDKATDIRRPVGKTGELEIQSRRNLPLKCNPVGINVSRPRRYGIALASGKRRPRQDEHALMIAGRTLSLVDGSRGHEREEVDIAIAASDRQLVVELDVFLAPLGLRFSRVQPPGVNS